MKLANLILGTIIVLVIISLGLYFESARSPQDVDSFQECLRAEYPIMESYPRQCKTGMKTFVEPHCAADGSVLTQKDAIEIAKNSKCGEYPLGNIYNCNEYTGTYWIDLEADKCSPACVISLKNRSAEINWRCTGLVS